MDLFILKIIGIITMFLDHYYKIIDGPIWFNILGRIAFPIFAFSINEGFIHTRDKKRYFIRLLIFGILVQIPAFLKIERYPLNIFFTLSFGILCLFVIENKKIYKKLKLVLLLGIIIFAEKIGFDYGAYGIILIILFHIFKNKKIYLSILFVLLNIVGVELMHINHVQYYSILSLIFIYLYNGKKGHNIKYSFYLFYPLHLMVLYFLEGILYK